MSEQHYRLIHMHMAQGRSLPAIELLRELLAADPDDADAHALLAFNLIHMKRITAAEAEAGMALTLEPQSTPALRALGSVRFAQRSFDEAGELIEQAIAIDPTAPGHLRALADVRRMQDRTDEAHDLLERALALSPEDLDTLTELGRLALGRGQAEVAESFALAALQIEAQHPDALVLMGRILLRAGRTEEAREHAIEALRANPADASALGLLAQIKARQSWTLGLWWRYQTWLTEVGTSRTIIALLTVFTVYRLVEQVLQDTGYPDLAQLTQVVWLAFAAYTWFAPVAFRRALDKEIGQIALDEQF